MSFLNELNKEQLLAVKSINGPVMIIAGAGSGKTRVLTYRIAYLINKGVNPQNILALTFTNKAAKEMKNRIIKLIGREDSGIWMGTFHSNFSKILRYDCDKLGFSSNFSIYDAEESLSMIKYVMSGLNIPHNQFNPYAVQAKISKSKNGMIYPEKLKKEAIDIFEDKVSDIYKEYLLMLKRNNAMDFDDLLLKPIELFDQFPEILSHYQRKFSYILVDEYQDTNKAQYVVLKLLINKNKNLCVVGDDAQSIYSFRGAELQNILDFQIDYKDHKIFRLQQNYRSTQNILSAADSVIKNNSNQIKKTLWTENHSGDKITLLECKDEKDEGMQIVKNIQYLLHRDKLSLNSFVILYRTNAQSRSLEDALRKMGMPYVIVGGIKFYERKEIKDVLAYLKFISNSKNDEALGRIINFPTRGIGPTTFSKIKEIAYKSGKNVFEVLVNIENILEFSDRVKNAINNFTNLIQKYTKLKDEMVISEFVRVLVDDLGILQEFKMQGTPESLNRMENVHELLSGITEFQNSKSNATLEDFLQEVALITDIDQYENSKNAITLMTVHSAKGLEYPVVFITGLEEGLFPHSNSMNSVKEIEEERRLFYVALTRAMKKVFLSFSKCRYRFGSLLPSIPSRFLNEIENRLIEKLKFDSFQTAEKKTTPPVIGPNDVKWLKLPKVKVSEKERDHVGNNLNEKFKIGRIVEHGFFGKGQIVEVIGLGDDMKVVVDFEGGYRKTLMVLYANLNIVE
jgi:DNA helicase-2/ATP-dependent DNA helicase PcrA